MIGPILWPIIKLGVESGRWDWYNVEAQCANSHIMNSIARAQIVLLSFEVMEE